MPKQRAVITQQGLPVPSHWYPGADPLWLRDAAAPAPQPSCKPTLASPMLSWAQPAHRRGCQASALQYPLQTAHTAISSAPESVLSDPNAPLQPGAPCPSAGCPADVAPAQEPRQPASCARPPPRCPSAGRGLASALQQSGSPSLTAHWQPWSRQPGSPVLRPLSQRAQLSFLSDGHRHVSEQQYVWHLLV